MVCTRPPGLLTPYHPHQPTPPHRPFFHPQAIAAIVETYTTRERASGERDGPTTPPPLPPSHYSLLVAEEDGTIVDPDFPEVCLKTIPQAGSTAHPPLTPPSHPTHAHPPD